MLGRFLLPAALVVVVAGTGQAQVLYGSTAGGGAGELYILNPANGAVVQDVGPLNDVGGTNYPLTGIAFNPVTGLLYGSVANHATAPDRLVTVNPATAQVTVIGSFNAPGTGNSMSDLSFTASGSLYGISSVGGANLYTINIATGQATEVGVSGVSGTSGGGLAISLAGLFYGTPTSPQFGTFDPTTGLYTNIAGPSSHPAGAGTGFAALAFNSSGVLYGDDLGTPAHLITIDPATATVTDLGASVVGLDGIAFSVTPVPEPSSLILCGMAAMFASKLRRRSHLARTIRT